jgi:hypothetical protein
MLAATRREMEEMITELRTLDSFSKLTRGEKELLNRTNPLMGLDPPVRVGGRSTEFPRVECSRCSCDTISAPSTAATGSC